MCGAAGFNKPASRSPGRKAEAPHEFVATASKAARKGKIYIDYLRNARGATAIAPYSTRKRDNATVSMPLHWSEVNERIPPDFFDVRNAVDFLQGRNDPWADMTDTKQSITQRSRRGLGLGT